LFTVVNGGVIVDEGRFVSYDLGAVTVRHEALSRALVGSQERS
jgi:hypothetical protein